MSSSPRCRPLRQLLVLLTVFAFTSCSDVADRKASSKADLNDRGFIAREFVDENGIAHRYVLFVPFSFAPGDRLPVILFFNGAGENGNDGVTQISNNFGFPIWEMREFFPFLIVAPQCQQGGSWFAGSNDTDMALKILDRTVEEYGADDDRIILTGVSSGGSGAWNVASNYPDRFAAVVPLCAGGGADINKLVESKIPIWSFYNQFDLEGVVRANQTMQENLITEGGSPLFTAYLQGGHDCWNKAYRSLALYRWMLEQTRSSREGETPFRHLPAESILEEWDTVGDEDAWTIADDGNLVVAKVEDGPASNLQSIPFAAGVELHAETRLGADSECTIALADENSVARAKIRIVLPDRGSSSVLNGRGEWIADLDPVAARSLMSDSWNDIRVAAIHGDVTVRINGMKAIELPTTSTHLGNAVAVSFLSPEDGGEVRWRYIRTRTPSATGDAAQEAMADE